jgi:hypothetical protein
MYHDVSCRTYTDAPRCAAVTDGKGLWAREGEQFVTKRILVDLDADGRIPVLLSKQCGVSAWTVFQFRRAQPDWGGGGLGEAQIMVVATFYTCLREKLHCNLSR